MKTQILSLIKAAGSNYPNWGPKDAEGIKLWVDNLIDIDIDVLRYVFAEVIRTERYGPTIADIRMRCAELSINALSVQDAYEQLKRSIREHGTSNLGAGRNALTGAVKATVDKIGYKALCEMSEPECRRVFCKVYTDDNNEKLKSIAMKPMNGLLLATMECKRLEG